MVPSPTLSSVTQRFATLVQVAGHSLAIRRTYCTFLLVRDSQKLAAAAFQVRHTSSAAALLVARTSVVVDLVGRTFAVVGCQAAAVIALLLEDPLIC